MLTSIFSRLVITFGDRPLPPKTLAEEIAIGLVLVIPLSILVGHVTMRIASRCPLGKFCRADIWNTIVRLLVADVLMELLLPSIQCLPLSNDPGYSLLELQQSWGFNCAETPAQSQGLSPTATGLLFGLRLTLVCIGVHIGESYFPIGLTGGIACGKSTVAHYLQQPKEEVTDGTVFLVDTDSIAHDILLPGTRDSVYTEILRKFPDDDILNDSGDAIDRRKLGAVVFTNREKRRLLNSITHPRITFVMFKKMLYGLFLSTKDLTIADVPLLYESGSILRHLFGLVVVVSCQRESLQLERLEQRNTDLTKQQCKDRIASQLSMETKVKMAHVVIDNSTLSLGELQESVEKVREELMHRVYGVGLSLLQLLIIIGGSVPVAVLSKLYTMKFGTPQ